MCGSNSDLLWLHQPRRASDTQTHLAKWAKKDVGVFAAWYLCYLSHHDREGKDSNKVVDELKNNLKEGGGVWQTTNGDQTLHRKVVTPDVTEERPRWTWWVPKT